LVVLVALCCGLADAARAGVGAGRGLEQDRNTRIGVAGGALLNLEGFVEETTRPLYYVTGNTYKLNPESYDETDFNADSGYWLVGLEFEQTWKYVTFKTQVLAMNPQTDAVARRNYYLTVGEINFDGEEYDHQKIPAGTPFTAELEGMMVGVDLLVTPLHVMFTETSRFTPWIGIGGFGILGSYEIDAGPATGTTVYQNPPKDFVVGGTSEGTVVGGLPELVLGGELVFGEKDWRHFGLQGQVGYFTYDGTDAYFSSRESEYDKNAEIEHWHFKARTYYDAPLANGTVLTLSLQFEQIDTEVEIRQTADTPEEILERQERYDKNVDFSASMLTGTLALAF
jgi:hypothetical protein